MSLKELEKLSLPMRIKEALQSFVERVKEAYPDAKIYLFGSYAKNTWIEDSDVDVVVISKQLECLKFHERAALLRKLASPEIPFSILAYTPSEFKQVRRKSTAIKDAMEYWIALS